MSDKKFDVEEEREKLLKIKEEMKYLKLSGV